MCRRGQRKKLSASSSCIGDLLMPTSCQHRVSLSVELKRSSVVAHSCFNGLPNCPSRSSSSFQFWSSIANLRCVRERTCYANVRHEYMLSSQEKYTSSKSWNLALQFSQYPGFISFSTTFFFLGAGATACVRTGLLCCTCSDSSSSS